LLSTEFALQAADVLKRSIIIEHLPIIHEPQLRKSEIGTSAYNILDMKNKTYLQSSVGHLDLREQLLTDTFLKKLSNWPLLVEVVKRYITGLVFVIMNRNQSPISRGE
jgi:hypothetical protein